VNILAIEKEAIKEIMANMERLGLFCIFSLIAIFDGILLGLSYHLRAT